MGKRGIVIKTLQNNKKLLAATIGAVLLHLPTVIGEFGYGYGALYIVADSVFWLIALLLVVASFVFNINDKTKPAIACAVASAIVGGISELIKWYGVLAFLSILPQIILIVFFLKRKKSRQMWACLTLVAMVFPLIIDWILTLADGQYPIVVFLPGIIISLLCNTLPLGLVYWFGYTADNNATQQPDVVQKATESSYLEAYKLNRKNGGK